MSFMSFGKTSRSYRSFNRGVIGSPIEQLVTAPADAYTATIFEDALPHAHGGVAFVAHDHQVRLMDRRFLFDDAVRRLRAARLGVALDHVQPLHDHASALRNDAHDLPGLAAIA